MPTHAEWHADATDIYEKLKIYLHDKSGIPADRIYAEDSLDTVYHFDATGLRNWCVELETRYTADGYTFTSPIDRDKMEEAATVLNAYMLVCDALGV